jgi:hypothetical protein
MVMADTNGSTIRGESLENVILAVFTLIGKITGFRSDEETVLFSCSESWLMVLTLHSRKVWFVLQTRVCCPPGHIPPDSVIINYYIYLSHASSQNSTLKVVACH